MDSIIPARSLQQLPPPLHHQIFSFEFLLPAYFSPAEKTLWSPIPSLLFSLQKILIELITVRIK